MEHEAVLDGIDNSFDRSECFAQELYSSWMSNPDHAGQGNAATLKEWKARQNELSNDDDLDDRTTFINSSVLGSEEATLPPPQLIVLLDLAVADVADQSQLLDAELKEALYRDCDLYLPPGNALALGDIGRRVVRIVHTTLAAVLRSLVSLAFAELNDFLSLEAVTLRSGLSLPPTVTIEDLPTASVYETPRAVLDISESIMVLINSLAVVSLISTLDIQSFIKLTNAVLASTPVPVAVVQFIDMVVGLASH
ncbi:hypothetical protein DAEQUDRAFT_770653 [Daedalea quercina L-15889]|uniref:Uncharacterized protein n=1 Tax=Daedalea quercina L-15889 TaxID=1314783 RepID=A0A165KPJ0_9APHY|nr:hypothetical protein DAEQUDRAFT_770653 [Daedalea quercina L-15889]